MAASALPASPAQQQPQHDSRHVQQTTVVMMMARRAAPPTEPPMIAASGSAEALGVVAVPGHAPTGPLVTATAPHCAAAETYGVPVALLRRNPPPEALLFDQVAAELEEHTGLKKEREPLHRHASLLD